MTTSIPTTTSTLDFPLPTISQPCKTSYTIFGSLKSPHRPLIVLHGGPGIPHNYLLPLRQLTALYDIPVIMYDQLGCGKSTLLPEKNGDENFWTTELFLDELDNLVGKLIGEGEYDLLGHSWGGMVSLNKGICQIT